jgi:Domain of unknown function (DUF4276)
VTVELYVEGGGDTRFQQSALRKAFQALLSKACGHFVNVTCCGGRAQAFRLFCGGLKQHGNDALLLVDAEGPVLGDACWAHVASREGDRWQRPLIAKDDQLHLMVELMESWFLADRTELAQYFGQKFAAGKLPGMANKVEAVAKVDVETGLKRATHPSSRGQYDKGRHSAELLGRIDPNNLKQSAPRFAALLQAIEDRVGAGSARK